jgi:hypothetical protein
MTKLENLLATRGFKEIPEYGASAGRSSSVFADSGQGFRPGTVMRATSYRCSSTRAKALIEAS